MGWAKRQMEDELFGLDELEVRYSMPSDVVF